MIRSAETCCADLNGGDGYRGLDVGHFECRQTGGVLGFTLSIQQLQTFTDRDDIETSSLNLKNLK